MSDHDSGDGVQTRGLSSLLYADVNNSFFGETLNDVSAYYHELHQLSFVIIHHPSQSKQIAFVKNFLTSHHQISHRHSNGPQM